MRVSDANRAVDRIVKSLQVKKFIVFSRILHAQILGRRTRGNI